MEYFTDPTPEEVSSGPTLIGNIINIFWDGDNVFYPAKVIRYDQGANTYWVLYENDATGQEYEENLSKSQWKIWRSTEEEFHKAFPPEVSDSLLYKLYFMLSDHIETLFQLMIPFLSMLRSIFFHYLTRLSLFRLIKLRNPNLTQVSMIFPFLALQITIKSLKYLLMVLWY